MSEILNKLLAQATEAVEASGIDMNEAVKGGGGRLLPKGYAFAQLVEYIELGMHAQEFNGKAKDPAMEVQLAFALSGSAPDPDDPTKTIPYNNDDGTPYIVRPWSFAISRNEKARAFLLFKALNWKGTAKGFAQLLGQKWIVEIVHEPKSKTDATIVSRLNLKGFLPPLDPVTKAPYPIADADPSLYKLFLWDRPTQEGWDSLKVEGTFEVEENGKKVQKSKNRTQETILGALNFQGSPLQQLLSGGVMALPTAAPASPVVAPAAPVTAQPTTPVVAPAVAAPVAPAAPVVAAPLAPVAVPTVAQPAVAAPIATPAVAPVAVPSSPVLPA